MKTKYIILYFLLNPVNILFPGDISLSVGINQSWLSYPHYPKLTSYFNSGYNIGITYNHDVFKNTKMDLGLGLFNIRQVQYESMEEPKVNHIYISIPIKVEYEIYNNISPFISIQPSILVNTSAATNAPYTPIKMENITDEMNRFNIFTGIGIKYFTKIFEQKFSVAGLMNVGLLRIAKDKRINSNRHWMDWRAREIVLNLEYYIGT